MTVARSKWCSFVIFFSASCLIILFIDLTDARRYRSCEEGCCIHEFCAYHRICYPKIHCRFGCPDGTCVGQEDKTATKERPDDQSTKPKLPSFSPKFTSMRALTSFKSPDGFPEVFKNTQSLTQTKHEQATPSKTPVLEERYFNQNNEIIPSIRSSLSRRAPNQIFPHVSEKRDVPSGSSSGLTDQKQADLELKRQSGMVSKAQDVAQNLPGPSGICMPSPPCKPKDDCGMGHVCTFNYNLGYNTCQYNLDIGSTLCYDKNGELNLQPS